MSKVIQKFDQPIILIGGGQLHKPLLQDFMQESFPFIAVDGGANAVFDLSTKPDYVIGDLDSLDINVMHGLKDDQVIKINEQDTSDFEKALYSFEAPQYLAFGFLGRRMDHCLSSYHILYKYSGQKNIFLMGSDDISFAVSGDFKMSLPKNIGFSIFPFAPIQFEYSKGLGYPLDGLLLEIGQIVSTSNITNADLVHLKPTDKHKNTPYIVIIGHLDMPKPRLKEILLA